MACRRRNPTGIPALLAPFIAGYFAYVETQKPELNEGGAWLSSPMLAPDAKQSCYVSRLTVPQATAGQADRTALLLRRVLQVSLCLWSE